MDLKLRIIIAFFSAIALFYICQFIISYMSKKEHFSSRYYDDVEKYESNIYPNLLHDSLVNHSSNYPSDQHPNSCKKA